MSTTKPNRVFQNFCGQQQNFDIQSHSCSPPPPDPRPLAEDRAQKNPMITPECETALGSVNTLADSLLQHGIRPKAVTTKQVNNLTVFIFPHHTQRALQRHNTQLKP